ncbi:MAG: Ankryin [Chthonomonadales bacterium]|nr:Ankryin [Chthonomonadales bacterium]
MYPRVCRLPVALPLVYLTTFAGADPNRGEAQGETPLMAAVSRGNLAIVALLLTKGANVSARNADGQTALKIAQEQKLIAMVNLLTAAGAKD